MVRASVEECCGKNSSLTYTSDNWKVVREGVITLYSTHCTSIQAGYQIDELRWYPAEGQDFPEYISFQRAERLTEVHIGCQQPNTEVTQTLREDTECQDAIYGRLLGCETRLLMALVSLPTLSAFCRPYQGYFVPVPCLVQRRGQSPCSCYPPC